MKKILIPIDGSKNSKKAIQKAKELAELTRGEVTLLYVVNNSMIINPYVMTNDYKIELGTILKHQGERILEEGLKEFGPYEGEINTALKYGDPGTEIISYAEGNNYDLVIIGSRGLNAISRMMLGSVSLKVINHIHTSVFVVKC